MFLGLCMLTFKTFIDFGCNISKITFHRKQKDFGSYEIIQHPGKVSQVPRHIPAHIVQPSYSTNALPSSGPVTPEIKSLSQIDGMRQACSLARSTLNFAKDMVKVCKSGVTHLMSNFILLFIGNGQVGITTEEIDKDVHEYVVSHGAYPSPLHYKGFPKSICTSINNVVCHGM